ncbi:hypothetical protein FBZ96_105680 [Bradyrhizobium stylosanthis]|uniref:Uncharacterized protein n=1 Tax=Bradyrhizobium stylosanthis TaxID=1803665 RepID=A0A560DPF7_9BRAD|nr:hypothetical protein FBZ96_105680 [Bradyrhizobium stylosanthis]
MVALCSFCGSGPSFANLAPYVGLIANGIVLLNDGSLMVAYYSCGTRL